MEKVVTKTKVQTKTMTSSRCTQGYQKKTKPFPFQPFQLECYWYDFLLRPPWLSSFFFKRDKKEINLRQRMNTKTQHCHVTAHGMQCNAVQEYSTIFGISSFFSFSCPVVLWYDCHTRLHCNVIHDPSIQHSFLFSSLRFSLHHTQRDLWFCCEMATLFV